VEIEKYIKKSDYFHKRGKNSTHKPKGIISLEALAKCKSNEQKNCFLNK